MKRLTALTAIVLLSSAAGFADIARPEPAKTPKAAPVSSVATNMSIRLDPDAKEARLIIPRSQLKLLRAQLDDMDAAEDSTAAVTAPSGFSRTQTAMTGVFLSLALVFGGMWFVRSGKAGTRTAKALVVILTIAGIASAATFVYANAGPPAAARSITGKMFADSVHMYGFGFGMVKLETSATSESVTLIVPNPKDKPAAE